MNRISTHMEKNQRSELDRVVEPLAEYICATERPSAVLRSVFSALMKSVEETNRIANNHFRVLNGGLS